MNQTFLNAIAPWHDRIETYFSTANGGSPERFELWKKIMGTLTDWDRNSERDRDIREYAKAGKKIVVVIPERAHPRLYLDWLIKFAWTVDYESDTLKNTHLIFSGGVVDQLGTRCLRSAR